MAVTAAATAAVTSHPAQLRHKCVLCADLTAARRVLAVMLQKQKKTADQCFY